ncbi:hypothetical protein [Weissella cibaria]|uniref:hypothetical protein n=1 Tax=Weissella cibaria TaxID=137591 RepID=UPI00143020E1|nr:hypothetical protein [Weissella cibaria]
MKLIDNYMTERDTLNEMGIDVRTFNQADLVKTAKVTPTWVHFGGGIYSVVFTQKWPRN